MVPPVQSLYGLNYASSADLGMRSDVFWSNQDPTDPVDWAAVLSAQLGGTRVGLPGDMARGMSTSAADRAQKYDDLLRRSLAVSPSRDLSREVRFRRLTELDVSGVLAVVSLAIPDAGQVSGVRFGDPFLTVIGAPCVSERGQTLMGPTAWPDVGDQPPRLLPCGVQRPSDLLYPMGGTLVHDSRLRPLLREEWLNHPLNLWSFSGANLQLVLGYSDPTVVPPDHVATTFPFWGSGDAFLADAAKRELISIAPGRTLDPARRLVAIPRLQLLGGDFQLPIGQVWSCQIGLDGFKQSLRTLAGGSDPSIGAWLDHPMLVEFFAAIARDPLAFATRWVWAADIAESVNLAAGRVPLCLRFPLLTVGYQCHRDFLLATLPLQHRRAFELYERNAQKATFLELAVYMGGAHLSKLGDLVYWRRPDQRSWRGAMSLASFIDTPCDPIGHSDYMRFVIKVAGEVTPRAWTTQAQARALLRFADQGVEEDDALASEFLGSVPVVGVFSPPPTPARRGHALVLPSVAEAAAAIRRTSVEAVDAQGLVTASGVSLPAASAGAAALTWFTSAAPSVLDPVLRGGGRRSPIARDVPQAASGFQWPTSTFPAVPLLPAARLPAAGSGDFPAVVNWAIQPDSADPRIRGYSFMTLMLVVADPSVTAYTQTGDLIPPEAVLFPVNLSEQWVQAVHVPPKHDLCAPFISQNFRNQFNSDVYTDAPKCNLAFFDARVLPLFASGRWRFDALMAIEEHDYKESFGFMHWLLMLLGSQYPPKIPHQGLQLVELRALVALIMGFFAQATLSREDMRKQKPNPFYSSLLAVNLAHIESLMELRLFRTAMEARPCECSVMVLNYLSQLFEIMFRWVSGAPEIHLGRTDSLPNVPMVSGAIFGPVFQEGTLLEKLQAWRESATAVLASVSSIGFIGQIVASLPCHLFAPPIRSSVAPLLGAPVVRSGVKRGAAGAPVPGARGGLPMGTALAPIAAVAGKQVVHTAAAVPIFDWHSTCDAATRAKSISSILSQLRVDAPAIPTPTFLDLAESDPVKARKQVCFAFCLAGAAGCTGFMPAPRGKASPTVPRKRQQACNRAHIDLGSAAWSAGGVTVASYRGICDWLKEPAVQLYFVPTQAFADSPLFTP